MRTAAEVAIERSISTMWDRHAEPLTLEELAAEVVLSKFYYSRVFRDVTGTSPGRFLTAIRLFMAKRYLVETVQSVTDITYRIGYNSPGTFTSRFTRSVGIPPTQYRAQAHRGLPPLTVAAAGAGRQMSEVTGRLHVPVDAGPVRVYVGAFSTPAVEGYPQSCDVLDGDGQFRLSVPDGLWFIRAAAVAPHDLRSSPRLRLPRLLGNGGAVHARNGRVFCTEVRLREVTAVDLPILLALPELDGPPCAAAARIPLTSVRR
jgi:AraC family transcriptional regulator